MASLEKIMNLDEDSSDPVQVKRERSASSISTQVPTTQTSSSSTTTSFPGSTPTSARHISLREQPFARPPRQRSSPSAYMAYSQASDSPALSSPSSSTTSRRSRSSISTGADTMDAMHYPQDHYSSNYGYASSGLYSDPASRGYSTVPATGAPVKYTPITGRVSRAKKGYPVHVCEQCRPSKTFTRAEHLRRHQLSHNPPELVCSVPACGKTFHRKDLLERHQHRHEQDSRVMSASGSGQHDPEYGRPPPPSQTPISGYGPSIPITSPHWHPEVDSTDMPPNSSPPGYPIGPMNPYSGHMASYGAPVPAWEGTGGMGASQGPQFMPPGPQWTPRTTMIYDYSAPAIASDEYHPVDMCGIHLGTEQILDAHHHGNSTVRSLPPVLVEGQSPETLEIALAAALSPCAVATSQQFSPCGSESRQMPNLLAAHGFAPVSLSRATQSFIPAYLEVYWARTYPVYPYIHRASFDGPFDGEATPLELLKCAMAALATQFLDDRKHRIAGGELHAFACQELKTFTEGEHWSLPVMQAVVCCEYYARFRGRDTQSYKPSSNYRKVYEMLVGKHNTFNYPLPDIRNKLLSWKRWVEEETLRRLLATCFMLDVHTSAYFKEPPILALGPDYPSLPMNQVPFSTDTNRLWECTDWESWARLVASDPNLRIVPPRTLADDFTPQDVTSMSGFDATVLMTGYASQLMSLAGSGEMDAEETLSSASSPASRLAQLFPASGVAQAYLAIHFTPLHALLSVSGNTWVLNRKIPEPNEFRAHTQSLDKWCRSERAAMAVSWAARALLVFLRIQSATRATGDSGPPSSSSTSSSTAATAAATLATANMDSRSFLAGSRAPWKDVSDYWGVYVCALICWAFGRGTQPGQDLQRAHDAAAHNEASRTAAVRWISEAAQLAPAQLLKWRRRRYTRGVVCLARDVLTRDCLADRSMLYCDAVGVLKRLGEPST